MDGNVDEKVDKNVDIKVHGKGKRKVNEESDWRNK